MDVTWRIILTVCGLLLSLLILKAEKGDRGPDDRAVRWTGSTRYRWIVVGRDGNLRRYTKRIMILFIGFLVLAMWATSRSTP